MYFLAAAAAISRFDISAAERKKSQQRLEHAKAKLRQEEELLEQKLAQPSEEPPKEKQRK